MSPPLKPASPPSDDAYAVLIVDDERSGIIPLKRLLQSAGFRVEEAFSADGAIRALERGQISVVITDWVMSVRDGISLLNEVAVRWPLVERVLYTGYHDSDAVLEAYKHKHRIFSKAASPSILVDLTRRLHRKALNAILKDHQEP